MRNILFLLFLLALAGCQKDESIRVSRDDFSVVPDTREVKGQVYFKFKTLSQDLPAEATRSGLVANDQELTAVTQKIGATRLERVFPYAGKFEARTRKAGLHLWYKLSFDENVNSETVCQALAAVPNVAEAEPVIVPQVEEVGFHYNDPYFGRQWYLYNSGIIEGSEQYIVPRADISILEAWEIEKGKPEVKVTVVDEIVDYANYELSRNMVRNEDEIYGEYGVDDDGNGYIDDAFGYEVNYSKTPRDHGTHVAGILAAKNNNNRGVCGIAGGDTKENGIRFFSCVMDPASIKYGADVGAVISTNSYGGGGRRKVVQDAVDYFVTYAGLDENGVQVGPMKGGIVIASAGNDNLEDEYFPAALDHVIAVASLGPNYKKSGFSNYGKWVDISAFGGEYWPGCEIYSTLANDQYGYKSGTSMAAPVVAGVTALIVSKFARPGLTAYEVEYRLMRGTKNIDQYNPNYIGKLGAGCVDALLALSDEPINFQPEVVAAKPIPELMVLAFNDKTEIVYRVSDPEDGTEVTYTVEDPSGAVTHSKNGGEIKLSLWNHNCVPGDYEIHLVVTDKGGVSVRESIRVKLQPEFLKEVVLYPNPVVDTLNIRASMTFSGKVTVKVFDVAGNSVLEQQTNISLSKPGQVDLSGIAGGSYTLQLNCNNKTIKKNIIKL